MYLKNTFTIFHTNLSLLYKTLLFIFVLSIIFACIVVAITSPLLSSFSDLAFNEAMDSIINNWLSGDTNTAQSASALFDYFQLGLSGQLWNYFWLMLGVVFFAKLLIGIIHLPVSHVLYNMMGLNCEVDFSNAVITHLGRSIGYSFLYSIITMVLDAIIVAVGVGLYALTNSFMGIFAFTLSILVCVFLYGLRFAILSQWVPLIIVEKLGIIKAFFASFKVTFVHFFRTTQSFCMISFVAFVILATTALPTFFTTVIVALPLIIIITSIVNLIANCVANHRNFYIDDKTIIEC